MRKIFHSNGKLLLTAEYLVLDGAQALALPTKFGQSLEINWSHEISSTLHYKAFQNNGEVWFEATIQYKNWKTIRTTDTEKAEKLMETLHFAQGLNSTFLSDGCKIDCISQLEFPIDWGLGSSSTFIHNIAQWAEVNPYQLLAKTFGGSGYDIACAGCDTAIFYTKTATNPLISEIIFSPPFKDDLYFVYLNQKQNSREAMEAYRNKKIAEIRIKMASELTQKIKNATTLSDFEAFVQQHENLISAILEVPTVKETLFADYDGVVKSLGAWGGDFVLITKRSGFEDYFKNKGYGTIIAYVDMILC